jgi:N-acetylmuramoyl-L-alanine amidase
VALLQHRQDNAALTPRGTGGGFVVVAGLFALPLLAACSGRPAAPDAAVGTADPADVAVARSIASGQADLPARAEALSLAQSIEAHAVREGAGVRAVELHAVAAALLERVWRVEGREQDAKEALDLYRSATREPDVVGACEAALSAARLAGDVARDAAATYAELYRAERRFASVQAPDAGAPGACRRQLEDALSLLVAFRPPQRVLEAIDEGLAGEGAISQALAGVLDAGPVSAVAPPQVARIEAWPGREATRVVIVLDRPAAYRGGDEVLAGGAPARSSTWTA